jgi:putative ABC transport system permease protein
MLGRLIVKSLWRERDRTALIVLSVATAAALISAFLNISFTVTEEMAKELRSFGANILLVPKGEPLEVEIGGLRFVSPEESAYLEEADLAKLKTIFWQHNVVAFAPFLSRMVEVDGERVLLVGTWFEKEIVVPEGKRFFAFASGARKEVAPGKGTFRTGLKSLSRWWRIEGSWPSDEEGVLIGSALARRLKLGIGMRVRVSYGGRSLLLPIRGIAQTGGTEEEKIFVDLGFAQTLFGIPGKVEKVQVSALVTPDNALALRANRIGPASLPPEEYETWYCTPYLSSIVYQIEEAIPNAKGKAIRRVSEAEATFLGKMRLTVVFTAAVALLVASLGVMATMVTAIFRRRQEIGLMKAMGAEEKQLRLLFLLEAAISGLVGGLVGYSGGLALTRLLSAGAFILAGSYLSVAFQAIIFLVTLVVGVGVALVGSFFPVREAARLEPVRTLRGN